MTREQRLRDLVAELDISAKMATTVFARMAYIVCMQKLEAILNEESEGWVLVPIWKMERAASVLENAGEENGVGRDLRDMLKAAPNRPANGSEK